MKYNISRAGMKPKDIKSFRRNSYYKSAIHAAVEYPGLAMLTGLGSVSRSPGVEGGNSQLPAAKQVRQFLAGQGLAAHISVLCPNKDMRL